MHVEPLTRARAPVREVRSQLDFPVVRSGSCKETGSRVAIVEKLRLPLKLARPGKDSDAAADVPETYALGGPLVSVGEDRICTALVGQDTRHLPKEVAVRRLEEMIVRPSHPTPS